MKKGMILISFLLAACGDDSNPKNSPIVVNNGTNNGSNSTTNTGISKTNNSSSTNGGTSASNNGTGNANNTLHSNNGTTNGGTTGSNNGNPTTRTGLEGYCDHYKECGGSYFSSAQDCIDASIDYWKECEREHLNAFGDCMIYVKCENWNPDTHNPASSDCSKEWSHVGEATNCD